MGAPLVFVVEIRCQVVPCQYLGLIFSWASFVPLLGLSWACLGPLSHPKYLLRPLPVPPLLLRTLELRILEFRTLELRTLELNILEFRTLELIAL